LNFELTILGSSSGAPTADRYQTAQHLSIRNEQILIDCGEATQMQLMRYGLGYMHINHIFISHLHADHYIGLIGLINTMNLNQRKHDLHVYAPEGLDEIIQVQLKHSAIKLSFQLRFHYTTATKVNIVLDHEFFTVTSIALKHRIPVNGFIFKEKEFPRKIRKDIIREINIPLKAFKILKSGEDYLDEEGRKYLWQEFTESPPPARSYAFITDTLAMPEIIPFISRVSMLYHEATFMEDLIHYSTDRFHSTNIEAAKIALAAGVKKLLIGHFSTRYKDLDLILRQTREIFPESYLATEGKRFNIPLK